MLRVQRISIALGLALVGCGGEEKAGEAGSSGGETGGASSGGSGGSEGSGSSSGGSSSNGVVPTTGDSEAGTTAGTESSGDGPTGEGWLRGFGAPEQQRPGGLGFDGEGALWVAGDLFGAIDLGTGPLVGKGAGLYLTKFAADGSSLLAQAMFPADGAATLTLTSGLAVDSAGAVIVTGWLEGTYTIGGDELAAVELDVFVGKWDSAGAPVWGRRFGDVDWQVGQAVAIGVDDAIWISGAALAGFTAGDVEVTGTGSTGIVVLRLSAAGEPEFGVWLGQEGDQEGSALALCDDGSVVVAGFFNGALQWGDAMVEAVGGKDMFVGALAGDGGPLWIESFGSASDDYATHVQCSDEVAFAGAVTGAAKIGDVEFSPVDQSDAVVGRLAAADGALVWAAGIVGPASQRPGGLALGDDGALLVALSSAGEATLGERSFVSLGDDDVLFARYVGQAGTPAAVAGLGGADTQRAGPLVVQGERAAMAATIAGDVAWPGLPGVTAAGTQDLAVLSFVPGP